MAHHIVCYLFILKAKKEYQANVHKKSKDSYLPLPEY